MNSSNRILEKCLKSIDQAKRMKNLKMFISDSFEAASNQARQTDSRLKIELPKSKIDGCLFTLKDNFCTRSTRTTCGSRMLDDFRAPYDATVYERLSKAGAICIGKTNLDEFGMGSVSSSYYGTVRNPWNLMLNKHNIIESNESNDFFIAGGSSGGSAASIASGICDFSIGSDTGGSIRNPSSICGCIGYKPTYGLISRYGLIPLNNYFDTVGILSSSMEILVDVLNVIAGPDNKDATSIKESFSPVKLDDIDFERTQLRIGVPQEFYPKGMAKSNLDAWHECICLLEELSCMKFKIVPVHMPNLPLTMSCYSVLTSCEIASNFSRYDGLKYGYHVDTSQAFSGDEYLLDRVLTKSRDESLGQVVKGRIVSGNYFLLQGYNYTYCSSLNE